MWPFRDRRRKDSEDVAAAKDKRDTAFVALDNAMHEVDRVHDQIISDYELAEQERLQR